MENSGDGDSKGLSQGTNSGSKIEEENRKLLQRQDSMGEGEVLVQELNEDLTGLFDVPVTVTEDGSHMEEVKQRITQAKRFYYLHFDCGCDLRHESFVKYSKFPNFDIGYKYKNLVEKMDKLELLVQLVNERYKLRSTCKTMYYREASLRLDKATNVDLLSKYVGISLHDNKILLKQELEEGKWFLKVYKNRLQYVTKRLETVYGLTEEEIKSVRDYDDILVFF